MQLARFQSLIPPAESDLAKPVFKFFIACEDQAAYTRVKDVQNQLNSFCGGRIEITSAFWNFPLFRHDHLLQSAITEAAEADIIVIALSGREALPGEVRQWFEHLPSREKGQAALLTLFDPELTTWEQQDQRAYFREVAQTNRLDFFCNVDEWESESPTPLFERMEELAPDQINSFHCPPTWDGWGIND